MKLNIYHPQSFEDVLDWFEPNSSATTTDHFADDPELLYLWSINALPKSQMQRFSAHLCNCEHCQNEIAEAIRDGALSIEDASESEEAVPPQPLSTPSEATYTQKSLFSQDFNRAPVKVSRAPFSSLHALCCGCLLLIAVCGFYQFGARAVQWASNQLDTTIGNADYSTSDSQKGMTRNRAITIPRSSSLPRKSLAMSLPPAEAQFWLIPSEFVEAPTKSLGNQVAKTDTMKAETLDVPEIPDSEFSSAQQRIAYGQLLLRSGQNEKAKAQFEKAFQKGVLANEAKIGRGHIAYLEKHFEQAYQIFSSLCSDTSLSAMNRFIVEYNAFKSAHKLEIWDEMRAHAEKSLDLLKNEESLQNSSLQSLKEEIEKELSF